MKKILVFAAMSMMLSGCLEKVESTDKTVSQDSSCYFQEFKNAKTNCKNGQIAIFAPSNWGNDQLPIYAASNFCDYRYSIVQNNGGVSCVFTDARLKDKPQVKKEENKEAPPK